MKIITTRRQNSSISVYSAIRNVYKLNNNNSIQNRREEKCGKQKNVTVTKRRRDRIETLQLSIRRCRYGRYLTDSSSKSQEATYKKINIFFKLCVKYIFDLFPQSVSRTLSLRGGGRRIVYLIRRSYHLTNPRTSQYLYTLTHGRHNN